MKWNSPGTKSRSGSTGGQGDFVYIPPYCIHKHFNADPNNEARIVVINSRIVKAMGFDWVEQIEEAEGYSTATRGGTGNAEADAGGGAGDRSYLGCAGKWAADSGYFRGKTVPISSRPVPVAVTTATAG